DEVLLLLAREAHCRPARDELTCRYWHQFKTNLRQWVRGHGLTSWDVEDAQQQVFFWIQEAVRAFHPQQLSLPQGSSFQTFLNRVVQLRLADFRRSLCRHHQRFRPVQEPDHWPKRRLGEQALASPGDREEMHLQLEQALRLLDRPARALWDALSDGK